MSQLNGSHKAAVKLNSNGIALRMRACPTLVEGRRPLIAHLVTIASCESRQKGLYHKCHKCVFRGKPASEVTEFVPEPDVELAGVAPLTEERAPEPVRDAYAAEQDTVKQPAAAASGGHARLS